MPESRAELITRIADNYAANMVSMLRICAPEQLTAEAFALRIRCAIMEYVQADLEERIVLGREYIERRASAAAQVAKGGG